MSPQEAAAFIVTRWRIEHSIEGIMMALLMQRVPVTRSQILEVVKRYCDSSTENATYKAQRRLGEA